MPKHLLLDIPNTIESERLIIRSPRPGDGTEFNAAVRDTMLDLQRWLGFYPKGPPTVDESEILMRQAYAKFIAREDFMLLLQLKDCETLVGSSGLHPCRWSVPSFEIGYWLRTAYRRQGLITEAVTAITQFAFSALDAKRVEIHCDEDNIHSAAVARRCGFEFEARLRNYRRNNENKLTHELIFSRIHPYPSEPIHENRQH